MPRVSAGLLMYRIQEGKLQVLLAHPGGPFFKNKDEGAWGIPKGEVEPGEDLLETAMREFDEETGIPPTGPFTALRPIRQREEKSFMHGHGRKTAIQGPSSATPSRWNGHQGRGDT